MPDRETQANRNDDRVQGRQSRRLVLFLRSSIFDYLLVLAVSTALAFTVSYGFNSAPELRTNIAFTAGVCGALLVVLYIGAWSKRALVVSAIGYVIAAVVAVGAISSLSPETVDLFVDGQVNDVPGNYAVFAFVLVTVPLVVYLLSRRTWGVAVLLFLGALACGLIQFLYRDWISTQPGTMAALVAYAGIGALFMMQGYRQGVMKSHIVKRTSFFGAFAYGVVGSLVCVGLGVAVFAGIISGLGLGTVDAKPFEDYFIRPVQEYIGTYQQQAVYDPNTATSRLTEEVAETNDPESGSDSSQDSQSGGGFVFVGALVDSLNLDEWNETFEAVTVDMPVSMKVFLGFLPVLIIALIVALRYMKRACRLKKIEKQPYPERVALLYNFFMRAFKRLKVEKPDTATPLEFALSSATELAGFMRNDSQADLLGITLIYQRAVYGAGNVTEEDYRYVRDYYRAFFKNAHARMGHPRWVLSGFWRI